MNRGRAPGPGRLEKRGAQWTLVWTDEQGVRQRTSLSSDRRTAERIRSEVIRKRDMARAGLGAEAGQGLLFAEVAQMYLEDLRPRVCPRHMKNVSSRLNRIVAALDRLKVRDLKPMHLINLRNAASGAGASHRRANLVVTTVQAMLRCAVENEIVAHDPGGAHEGAAQKIAEIKAREAPKQAKAQPEGRALLLAVKSIDKTLAAAAEARNDGLVRAEAAGAPLSEQVVAMGIRLPDPKAKRGGRRRKGEAA